MQNFINLFLEKVQQYPDRIAVADRYECFTYKTVDAISNMVAMTLVHNARDFGVELTDRAAKAESCFRIGVLLNRSRFIVPISIGIMRSGCVYVPIDADYPLERIKAILIDAKCNMLMTTKNILQKFGVDGYDSLVENLHIITVDEIADIVREKQLEEYNFSNPEIEGVILYTSGSTGKPKGVVHLQGIVPVAYQPVKQFLNSDMVYRHCAMAGFNFVSSLVDLFLPLTTGGSVYVADEEERINADKLYDVIKRQQIDIMFMPPKMFTTMLSMYGELPLKWVVLGGEKMGKLPITKVRVMNVYGSTETAGTFVYEVDGLGGESTLGSTATGVVAYIIDEAGNKVTEPGVVGELCVTTPSLATGYNGLPEQTAQHFVECSWADNQMMYCTGDMASWNEEGKIDFHGRRDRLIKLRGYRVELGELESVLSRYDDIQETVCIAKKVNGGDKLCCFWEGKENLALEDIKAYAARFLPDYMIPDIFIRLEQIPRNANGKVDYKKINALEVKVEDEDFIAPESDLEKLICAEYSRILNLAKISVMADFFRYGGTSLTASMLVSSLDELGYKLSYSDISHYPSPRELASFLSYGCEDMSYLKMEREFYPLTKTQLGIFLEGMAGGSKSTYTCPYLMGAATGVTVAMLQQAVQTVVKAHPCMKYIIKSNQDGKPYMYLVPEAEVEVPVFKGKAEDRLQFMQEFAQPVPVENGLLFYFAVYKTEKNCYLALRGHLIFFDGTSISLLIAELNRALAGKELLGEGYSIQQVGMLEEHMLSNGAHDKAKEYYDSLFSQIGSAENIVGDLNEPLVAGVSENQRYEPKSLSVHQVKEFCAANQVTESAFFMSAMSILLGKYLNRNDVAFSTVYNGRSLAETANTMGTMIKRIPVVGKYNQNVSVKEYIKRMGQQIFSTMSNDIYSFDEVLKNYPVNEDVEFIYQGDLFTDNMGKTEGEALIEGDSYFMEHYHTGMVTGCMSIQFFATDGWYNMTMEYRNQRFSKQWIQRFAENLFTIAETMLEADFIGDIVMLPKAMATEINAFNDTSVDINFTPVHQQVHNFAVKTPDKPAVIANGRSLTFKELDWLSNQVACALLNMGVRKNSLVAVLLDREVWAYVAENAIMKAGAAFLPFVPAYPDERIDFCMKDGDCPIIITTESLKEKRNKLFDEGYEFLTLEEIFGDDDLGRVQADVAFQHIPDVQIADNDLAYCIYTSGSTGRPKGVMIEHRNIANYVHRNNKSIEIIHYAEPDRICLAMAAFSFDVSIVEQFIPLCNGNTVVLATEEEIHDPFAFAKVIMDNNVSGLTCTPTYLMGMLDIPEVESVIRQLKFFDIGAEAFPAGLYDRLRKLRRDSIILNVYGPTECTMGCAASIVDGSGNISVGAPIANTSFYIADRFGNELPIGVKGELIICGDCVGRGYVKLPDKTAAAFFMHNGLKAYHSGDLAVWTDEGEIRIFGRIDNQVKLRGFRIELDEIENVMCQFTGIKTSAVAVKKTGNTEFLAAYFTADREIDVEGLKAFLQDKLTEFMVPSTYMQLTDMPQTANGKVDRRALPEPDFQKIEIEYVSPRDDLEEKICLCMAQILQLEVSDFGIKHDFFAMGGDSLGAIQLLAKLNISCLTARDVFQDRTPEIIAKTVREKKEAGTLDDLDAAARKVPHCITPLQTIMIDNQFYNLESTMWSNMNFMLRFDDSKVDAQRLCQAVNKAFNHHPALSAVFSFNVDGDLQQQYMPGIIKQVELEEMTDERVKDILPELMVPFKQYMNSCLCRVRMFKTPGHSYLFVDVHHLLMDGGSFEILLGSIVKAYKGEELPHDYYYAMIAEEEHIKFSGVYDQDKEFMENKYGGKKWCDILPLDYDVEGCSYGREEIRFRFTKEEVEAAEKRWGVSQSIMAITSALLALGKYSGRNDVMTNWIFNYRMAPETVNMVGMLIKNMPAAVSLNKFSSMQELLKDVQQQVTDNIAHCSYDYFAVRDSAFKSDPMKVDLQLGINGSVMYFLEPEVIDLPNSYTVARARMLIGLLENEYGDGAYDSEIRYAAELFNKESISRYHDMYMKQLTELILGTVQ